MLFSNKILNFFCQYKIYIFIATMFFFWLFFRIYNIDWLYPFIDENTHTLAANEFLEHWTMEYSRAMLVSIMTTLSYYFADPSWLEEYLFWWRFFSAFFSALVVIPLFFLAKKVNNPTAYLASILWITSPWAIWVGQEVREYSYYVFFILLFILIFINFIEKLNSEKSLNKLSIFYLICILWFAFYALLIDNLSTLIVWVLLIWFVAIYYLIYFVYKYPEDSLDLLKKLFSLSKIYIVWIFLALWAIIVWALAFVRSSSDISLMPRLNLDFVKVFFSAEAPPMHWWYWIWFEYLAIILLIISLIFAYKHKNKFYFLYFNVFVLGVIFYTFFFARYFEPKYIFYLLPFFIILISMSIYSSFAFIKIFFESYKKYSLYATFSIVFIIIFNPVNVFYAVVDNTHWQQITTWNYHYQLENLKKFLDKKDFSWDEIFVNTAFNWFLKLEYWMSVEQMIYYPLDNPKRFEKLEKIIKENKKWYLILDYHRNWKRADWFPHDEWFKKWWVKLENLFNQDWIQVYKWNH